MSRPFFYEVVRVIPSTLMPPGCWALVPEPEWGETFDAYLKRVKRFGIKCSVVDEQAVRSAVEPA